MRPETLRKVRLNLFTIGVSAGVAMILFAVLCWGVATEMTMSLDKLHGKVNESRMAARANEMKWMGGLGVLLAVAGAVLMRFTVKASRRTERQW